MARTSTKVFVLEVMGRHAGWIAAAGGLIEEHGIPRRHPVSRDRVRRGEVHRQGRRAGEGARLLHRRSSPKAAHHADGSFLAEQGTQGRVRPRAARRRGAGRRAAWSRTRSASSSTGRSPTTCSARRATSPRRPTCSQAYELGQRAVELALEGQQRRHADHRAHVRRAVRATGSASPTSPTSPTSRSSCRATSSATTASRITEKCRRYLRAADPGRGLPGVSKTACRST